MKKTIYNRIAGFLLLVILGGQLSYAQSERNKSIIYSYLHGWEYSIKAGLSIGGTSPLLCQRKYAASTAIHRILPLLSKEMLPSGLATTRSGV